MILEVYDDLLIHAERSGPNSLMLFKDSTETINTSEVEPTFTEEVNGVGSIETSSFLGLDAAYVMRFWDKQGSRPAGNTANNINSAGLSMNPESSFFSCFNLAEMARIRVAFVRHTASPYNLALAMYLDGIKAGVIYNVKHVGQDSVFLPEGQNADTLHHELFKGTLPMNGAACIDSSCVRGGGASLATYFIFLRDGAREVMYEVKLHSMADGTNVSIIGEEGSETERGVAGLLMIKRHI